MVWKTDEVVLPRVEGSDCCEGRIEVSGITGSVRGRNAKLADGSEIRPDLAIVDDPQTHGSAKSPSQCDDREEIIKTDVMGLPGPGEEFTVFIPCTVIKKGDLADRLLDHELNPDFMGIKTAAMESWPDNLEESDETDGMATWEEYNEVRIEGLLNEDKGKAANEYYIEHCLDLEKGAKVGWDGRKEEKDVSALQSLMHKYFKMGKEAFYSEYQNSPIENDESIYDLTPQTVCSRLNGLKRLQVPDEATILTAMGDCNYVGINVTVIAFKNDFTGYIVDHFKYPEGEKSYLVKPGTPENVAAKKIAQGVLDVEKILSNKVYSQGGDAMPLDLLQIDANWLTDHVMAALRQIKKRHVIANRGTGVKKYRVPRRSPQKRMGLIGTPYHKCHREWGPKGKQIRHDSDFWRSTVQKAFLLSPGISGSLSLWGDDPNRHLSYAHEICCEKLRQYLPGDPYDFYDWTKIPGQANDQLDSTVGCYVGASVCGASLDGITRKRKRPPKPNRQNRGVGTNGTQPKSKIRTNYG